MGQVLVHDRREPLVVATLDQMDEPVGPTSYPPSPVAALLDSAPPPKPLNGRGGAR